MPKRKTKKSAKPLKDTKAAQERKARRKQLHHDVHGDIYNFLHQPWRLTIFMVIMTVVVVVIAQFLYPGDRAAPFTTIQGEHIGAMTQPEIAQHLHEKYDTAEVVYKADDEMINKASLAKAGMTPEYGAAIDAATSYVWWERLMPFSLFTKHFFTDDITLHFASDDTQTKDFVHTELLPKCNVEPVSATIEIIEGSVVLKDGKAGRMCSEEGLLQAVQAMTFQGGSLDVSLPHERVESKRSKSQVETVLQSVENRVENGIEIQASGQAYTATREEVLGWVIFQEDDKGNLKPGLDTEKVRTYVEGLNEDFKIEPQPASAELHDGQQRNAEGGVDGRELNIDATIERIVKAFQEEVTTVEAEVVVVAPETHYSRHYSSTDAGLKALLDDLVRQKGDYGITVIELDGEQRSADSYGTQSYTMASTYKAFVAYSVLKAMEAGRIHPGQHIRDGMHFEACWDEMLKYSLNPCSWTFADMVGGWHTVQQQMHAQGLTDTYLNGHDKRSTANDEALFFAGVETGELLQGESRERLLNTLREQIYKTGIPAGAGYPAANKIGFYNGYLHDVGVVYAPQGRYVLAVMTYGGSWGGIADVARQVQEFLAR